MVKTIHGRKAKISNRGSDGVFVGHVQNCAGDTYRMYVPGMNAVNTSQNIMWMKKMHYKRQVQEPVGTVDSIDLITSSGKVGKIVGSDEQQEAKGGTENKDNEGSARAKEQGREEKEQVKTVRFAEEEKTETKREKGEAKREEVDKVVIEFDTDQLDQDKMLALSRSIGKR